MRSSRKTVGVRRLPSHLGRPWNSAPQSGSRRCICRSAGPTAASRAWLTAGGTRRNVQKETGLGAGRREAESWETPQALSNAQLCHWWWREGSSAGPEFIFEDLGSVFTPLNPASNGKKWLWRLLLGLVVWRLLSCPCLQVPLSMAKFAPRGSSDPQCRCFQTLVS